MGVGMAIPLSMQLKDIHFIKIGDHIRSISKYDENETDISTSKSNPWTRAMQRENTLICLQVVIDGKPLCIGTYHMPRSRVVLTIHASVVKHLMFQLAGDFNLTPFDTVYQALTEKDYINVYFQEFNDQNISYRPNAEQVLKSSYREKNGSEPVYTNFSHTIDDPNYCATLDYIFFNGQLTVENVLELPDQPTGKSYPDETHPSDHLMIAATFRLP
jgi:endonuclease/exonuclease/phosphatase family metal-dependent hydrolase